MVKNVPISQEKKFPADSRHGGPMRLSNGSKPRRQHQVRMEKYLLSVRFGRVRTGTKTLNFFPIITLDFKCVIWGTEWAYYIFYWQFV